MGEIHEDSDLVLAQFNRLIQELLRGNLTRNTFRPWEVEILLDIETCILKDSNKRETLRRYQKSVQRRMEKGASRPMMLSEYLEGLRLRRESESASESEPREPMEAVKRAPNRITAVS
jgi:hypothetical protein